MLESRRPLVIGGVLVGVIGVAMLATFLLSGGRDPQRSVCGDLIELVLAKKYNESYALLSSSAQESDSKDSWRSKMIGLENVYFKGQVTYVGEASVPTREADPEGSVRNELRYTIKSPSATNDVSCYTFDNTQTTTVDGYISQVRGQ